MSIPAPVADLAVRLAELHGVVAVALGGSRASGTHRPDSDWDLGLYYRGAFDPAPLTRGSAVGEWGPIVNGGAWLTLDGLEVDVLYRDLDRIERWTTDAEHGRYDVLAQNGYLVGAPTYLPAGELALCRPLSGVLPRPAFPDALAAAAPRRWQAQARVDLMFAAIHADAGDAVCCAGMLARAVLCTAHARLATRREWVLTEKRLVGRAGLEDAQRLLAGAGPDLPRTVGAVAALLGLEPLRPRP